MKPTSKLMVTLCKCHSYRHFRAIHYQVFITFPNHEGCFLTDVCFNTWKANLVQTDWLQTSELSAGQCSLFLQFFSFFRSYVLYVSKILIQSISYMVSNLHYLEVYLLLLCSRSILFQTIPNIRILCFSNSGWLDFYFRWANSLSEIQRG